MFNLTKTFQSPEGLHVSPILMNGEPVFFPGELEEQLGYTDLVDSINKSALFVEGKDFIVVTGANLQEIKELLRSSNIPLRPPQLYDRIRFAPSLMLLLESGFYGVCFMSKRTQSFRLWVTSEVLPAIRRTGTYTLPAALLPDPYSTFHLQLTESKKAMRTEVESDFALFRQFPDVSGGTVWRRLHPLLYNIGYYLATGLVASQILLRRCNHMKLHCGMTHPIYGKTGGLLLNQAKRAVAYLELPESNVLSSFLSMLHSYLDCLVFQNMKLNLREVEDEIYKVGYFAFGKTVSQVKFIKKVLGIDKKVAEEIAQYNASPQLCSEGYRRWLAAQSSPLLIPSTN